MLNHELLQAACRGVDPELFAPATYEGPGAVQAEQARAVCAGCPVRDACLAEALAHGDQFTVRGGTTPAERAAARRAWTESRPARTDHELVS